MAAGLLMVVTISMNVLRVVIFVRTELVRILLVLIVASVILVMKWTQLARSVLI